MPDITEFLRRAGTVINKWRKNALEAIKYKASSSYYKKKKTLHCFLFSDFFTTTAKEGYDVRRVDITPLEQRKLTFDTHALVQDLETHGEKHEYLLKEN